LIQAITAFEKVILVAHSTPGMYVQTMPELEKLLHGLVLIGSAPDASWQKTFEEHCKKNTDSIIFDAEQEYIKNPNNESLRKLLIAAAKFCFVTEKSLKEGKELFMKIPVNHAASDQASNSFNSEQYQATWIPKTVNTLITTGSSDHITPLTLFQNNKKYQRTNILLKEILGAGHYPWFENPAQVVYAFQQFIRK
jgi:pimeloyl-ACP methyl ester carboxylesterase